MVVLLINYSRQGEKDQSKLLSELDESWVHLNRTLMNLYHNDAGVTASSSEETPAAEVEDLPTDEQIKGLVDM